MVKKILFSLIINFSLSYSDNCLEFISKYKHSTPYYGKNRVTSFVRNYVPGSHVEDKYYIKQDTLILEYYEEGVLINKKLSILYNVDSLYYMNYNGNNVDSTILTDNYKSNKSSICNFNSKNLICVSNGINLNDTLFFYENYMLHADGQEFECSDMETTCECTSNANPFYKYFSSTNYYSYGVYQIKEDLNDTTFRLDTLTYYVDESTNIFDIKLIESNPKYFNVKGSPVKEKTILDRVILKK